MADVFQSPSGDSLFSDVKVYGGRIDRFLKFQSPSGDSLFSDKMRSWEGTTYTRTVSIP